VKYKERALVKFRY